MRPVLEKLLGEGRAGALSRVEKRKMPTKENRDFFQ
jgi:hypothetical protein